MTVLVVLALIERGDCAAAHRELVAYGLTRDLGPTWPANRVRYARRMIDTGRRPSPRSTSCAGPDR